MKQNKHSVLNAIHHTAISCLAVFVLMLAGQKTSAQATYTWSGFTNGSWTDPTKWTPNRTTPAANDIIRFNIAGTFNITDVPTQTIGKLQIIGSSVVVNLNATATNTLTIAGGTGTDLSVPALSNFQVTGASILNVYLSTGATGIIDGNIAYSNAASTLDAADPNAITFNSGATFTQASGSTVNVFTTGGTANAIVFANGSTFIQNLGADVFGLPQPNSKVIFQTGSLFKYQVPGGTPSFSGRTYANFEYNKGGSSSPTGGAAFSIDNLTVTQGILNINMTGTPGHVIKNNISVANAASLTFTPSSAGTVNLNGASVQTVSTTGTGTISLGSNATLNVPAGVIVDCGTSTIGGTGNITINGTLRTTNTNGLSGSATSTLGNTQSSITLNPASTIVYNGSGAQSVTGTTSYGNLSTSTGGIKSLAGPVTLTGNLNIGPATTLNVSANNHPISIAGDWTNSGSFLKGAGTVTFNKAGIQTIAVTGGGTENFNAIAITNSSTVKLSSGPATNITVSGVNGLSLQSSGLNNIDLNGQQLVNSGGGNLTISGSRVIGSTLPGALFSVSGAALTVSGGTVNFGNTVSVVLSTGMNFGSSATVIQGSLRLDAGGIVNINPPIYSNGSTLIYNSGGTYGRGLEWSATSGPGFPKNVTVQNGTTLDLGNGGSALRVIGENLALGTTGSGGSLTMGAMTDKLSIGSLSIGGSTGTSTLTLSTAAGGDIELYGNWTRNANGSFVPNAGKVIFYFVGTSSITTVTPEQFNFLTIAKTGGGSVALSSNIQVNNNLTFLAGTINTGASKVVVSSTSPGSVIQSGGHVNGKLQRAIGTGSATYLFPVGDASTYRPVTLDFNNVTAAGDLTVFVSPVAGDHPNIGTSCLNANKSVNRFWTLTNTGIAGGTYNATFKFVAGDVDGGANTNNFVVGKYIPTTWTYPTVGTRTVTSTQITGETSFGDFTIAELNTFTITTSPTTNGTINPGGSTTVNCGADQTYTITPAACYHIADVLVDGVSNPGAISSGSYTFTNVVSNHTISATFAIDQYSIMASSGTNGSVTPAGATPVNCGDGQTYTITPAACYHIADVLVDGVSNPGAISSGSYTFTNVVSNHTISATFAINQYSVMASSGTNGSVTPAGATPVNCGDGQTYTITPAACYHIADVLVDGVSNPGAISSGSYTFTNVVSNHTISATFAINQYSVMASSGTNGSVTPAGATTVNCGDGQTYTIKPAACYQIADVLVDGVSNPGAISSGSYTFTNVVSNHTISATFAIDTYTISVTQGSNGTITPNTTIVNCGSDQSFTITPAACYHIADVLVDGVSNPSAVSSGSYTFTEVQANHTITASFAPNTYTITVTQGSNGTINPATVAVNCGGSQTFTITPAACYRIADVLVDGVSNPSAASSGSYTFTDVQANHTITASFALDTYTITVTQGSNGTINPGTTTVNCGGSQTFTITPAACYRITDVLVDGVSNPSAASSGSYTFTDVQANNTITASFALDTYTITVTQGSNGTINPGTTTVNCGGSQTFTITPAACYRITDVLVDGVSNSSATSSGSYTFTDVQANHTITASFTLDIYTITVTQGSNGTINPGTTTINCGGSQTFTITPAACYRIANVLVDGVSNPSAASSGSYTFTDVQANHTITASFAPNTYTITVTQGSNGTINPGTTTVNCGGSQTFTITPAACYRITDVLVDGVSNPSAVSSGSYTFTDVQANHTITASFTLDIYTITVTQGSNGTINPGTTTINCGGSQTFTITPAACYSIANVLVDGVSNPSAASSGSYTFTDVQANHTITASFALNTYTISVTQGSNGTINPGTTTVNCGGSQTFTITPAACYRIADVLVDGVSNPSAASSGSYTFTDVQANHTITASFALNTYTISVTQGSNGTINPGTTTVNCGGSQTFTITPAACYRIADVLVDGVSNPSAASSGSYTFTDVQANHTITASFVPNTYTISVTQGSNGTINPGTTTVNCGGSQTFTITPAACYRIADVLVDGVSNPSAASSGSYTFTDVQANHTITASFALNTYTITVTQGSNGTINPGTTTVNCGGSQTFTITPAPCYRIANILVDGVSNPSAVSSGSYTFTDVQANHTITASFIFNTYTITVTQGSNGTINPGTTTVNCGGSQTFTITPAPCYRIANILVDGVSNSSAASSGSHTFTDVRANHTITASFVFNTYTITVTQGSNGTITPGTTTVNCGGSQTFTITPAPCYRIANVLVDGVSNSSAVSSGSYTFTDVQANHTITASFTLDIYTITVTQGSNGTINPGTTTVNCGGSQTFTITPAACYRIANILVDGVSNPSAVSSGSYTFTDVQANHTITASFIFNTYTITVTQGSNGTINPGTTTVNCGGSQTFTITPAPCYRIANILVDGVSNSSAVSSGSHTFTDVRANHTITASFVFNTYTIIVTQGSNGTINPGTTTVNCGGSQTFTITPAPCYRIADVLVDGVSNPSAVSSGSYTFTDVQANHTITASFAPNTYTITVTQGSNGTINPGTTTVNCGGSQTFTITPAPCYRIADVLVDGVSNPSAVSSGSYTFTDVQANHTITASFAPNTYTITVTQGSNGTINPGTTTVNCGGSQTFTITPAACYRIADVLVDGVSNPSAASSGSYTFTDVQANHTITASFALNTYTISVTQGSNGTINPGTTTVNCGGSQTFTITPAACYRIADVLVDGVSNPSAVSSGSYTFTDVQANHTITASFVPNTYTISVTQGSNGTINPATVTVNCGGSQTFTITPAPCYRIADVLVDGVSNPSAVSSGSYTFTDVQANHTITASFAPNTYTITVTQGSNGTINPGTTTVNCGGSQTITITPAPCYRIANVLVDGVSNSSATSSGIYAFTDVRANHTISASFAISNQYTITASSGANGTVTPSGSSTVNCSGSKTYTITPAACYRIANVLVDGITNPTAINTGSYTFTNVQANHMISATFVINNQYTIAASSGTNGTVTPSGSSTVNCGSSKTYTITPAPCYRIASVIIDGTNTPLTNSNGIYTFTNVQANHTISATFAVSNPYTITATSGANGTVTPSGSSTVNCSGSKTYTITPAACYRIANVLVDGMSNPTAISSGTYTFTNVQANHTISATFTAGSLPSPGTINGASTVCVGSSTTFTISGNSISGIWSSSDPAVAKVSAGGVVTGISAGNAAIKYTVTNGCSSPFATKSITVLSGVPTVSCASGSPFTRNAGTACKYTIAGNEFNASVTCSCGSPALSYTLKGATSGTGASLNGVQLNKGATTITWKATNGSFTSTCAVTVNVKDNQPPAVSCKPGTTKQIPNSSTGYLVSGTEFNATASDNCGTPSLIYCLSGVTVSSYSATNTSLAGKTLNVGTTTITWKATDAAGNASTCNTIIKVTKANYFTRVSTQAGGSGLLNDKMIEVVPGSFTVKVMPNPSMTSFTLQINSHRKNMMNIKVTDVLGRVIELKSNIVPNSTVKIGGTYFPGSYIAEIIQGREKVAVQLIKMYR